ncbi:MAG: protease complex subunit PrcB family protein [Acidobacteria bacterium]|nr:protease complex subunit PrcB family protein [Acidobacteriota bacterium]
MNHALPSLLVLLLIGFPARSALRASQDTTAQGTPLPITQLGPKRSGPRFSLTLGSGIWDRRRMVIRDRETWSDAWKRIHSPGPTHDPYPTMPPLPAIDFSREMLVVVTMGERPTGGYAIIVDGVYERAKQIEIVVRNISPGRGCGTTQSLTQPVDIVQLPKREGSIVFRDLEVVNECK